MSSNSIFPSTIEIKRILAAVQRSGVPIGKIEIEPARIRVFSAPEPTEKPADETAYDVWMREEQLKPPKPKRR